jgi:hypothetical protein
VLHLRKIGRALAIVVLGAMTVTWAGNAHAHQWLEECDINFDNNFALSNVYDQARTTFAVPTSLSATGQLEVCQPGKTCWTYRQRCGVPGYVNVEPLNYPHFHLSFEDPLLTCFANGGFGRMVNGMCQAADWAHEPRVVNPHDQTQWIKVWLGDRVSGQPRVFDVSAFRVTSTQPVQFWFQKTDGSWWFWGNLGPGNWNLSNYAVDVMQVLIRGSDAATSTPTIANIVIRA